MKRRRRRGRKSGRATTKTAFMELLFFFFSFLCLVLWGFQFKPLLARMEKGEKKNHFFFWVVGKPIIHSFFFCLFMLASFFHAPFSSLEKIMGFFFFFLYGTNFCSHECC